MPKSSYLNTAVINAVLRSTSFTSPTTVYLALFNGNPASGGTETSGGSYARQAITFGTPSSGSSSNSAALTFSNMPATTVSHVAIYDAATAGNQLYYAAASSSKTTNAGDTVSVAIGGIVVTEG